MVRAKSPVYASDELTAATCRALPQVAGTPGRVDLTGMAGVLGVVLLGVICWSSLSPPPVTQGKKPLPPETRVPQTLLRLPPMTSVFPGRTPVSYAAIFQGAPVMREADADDSLPTTPMHGSSTGARERNMSMLVDMTSPPEQPAVRPYNAADPYASRFSTGIITGPRAMSDPSLVIPEGTILPATFETVINSDYPGSVCAITSRDVRGFDGTKILIPQGSRLVGQYKSAMTQGETRVFIIWSHLTRPDGLSVDLALPVADSPGPVDARFADRFNTSSLVSIAGGVNSAGAEAQISQAVTNRSLRAPTLMVPQGMPIQVRVARDLEFRMSN